MAFDLDQVLSANRGDNFSLYARNINPQLVRVLRSIGFDRFYERGEGAYLFDEEGTPLFRLSRRFRGFGDCRSHPVVKRERSTTRTSIATLPNLSRWMQRCCPACWRGSFPRCHPGMGRGCLLRTPARKRSRRRSSSRKN